ncbi:MAG: trimeric intracellular cation channel family protein [Kiritimatiellae bacterium]|nr:trimeric intracellular cation channel family protein [Kiritimatiellia bacterium]
MDTLYIFSLVGVGFFAISGVLTSSRKGFDMFGVVVIALVTAIGGGTLRDILLDRRPIFWIGDINYLYFSLLGAGLALLWVRYHRPPTRILLYADALGLALFTISGTQIANDLGFGAVVSVLMGCITGVAGGVIRDMLSVEIPLLLRDREVYATASLLGAIVYLVFFEFGEVDKTTSAECGMLTVAIIRFAAINWRLRVPVFNPPEYK